MASKREDMVFSCFPLAGVLDPDMVLGENGISVQRPLQQSKRSLSNQSQCRMRKTQLESGGARRFRVLATKR